MRRFILILLPLVIALSGCGSATNRAPPPPLRAAAFASWQLQLCA